MIDEAHIDTLLQRFREWLKQTQAETAALEGAFDLDSVDSSDASGTFRPDRPSADGVGLIQLIEEFTALRHEVKLQTKSARGLEEQTEQTLAALGEAATQFRAVEAKEAEAAAKAAEPFVDALIEFDEAVERGCLAVENARRRTVEKSGDAFRTAWDELAQRLPAWKRWLCRGWLREAQDLGRRQAEESLAVLDALQNGYAMLQNRLQKNLVQREIARLDCLGEIADPHYVTVVEAVEDPSQPSGVIVEIIRPGYLWKNRVHRFAEVRAVR